MKGVCVVVLSSRTMTWNSGRVCCHFSLPEPKPLHLWLFSSVTFIGCGWIERHFLLIPVTELSQSKATCRCFLKCQTVPFAKVKVLIVGVKNVLTIYLLLLWLCCFTVSTEIDLFLCYPLGFMSSVFVCSVVLTWWKDDRDKYESDCSHTNMNRLREKETVRAWMMGFCQGDRCWPIFSSLI